MTLPVFNFENNIKSAQKIHDSLITTSERNDKLIRFIAYAENISKWITEAYEEKERAKLLSIVSKGTKESPKALYRLLERFENNRSKPQS